MFGNEDKERKEEAPGRTLQEGPGAGQRHSWWHCVPASGASPECPGADRRMQQPALFRSQAETS